MGVNLISRILTGQTPALRSGGSDYQSPKNYATNPTLMARLDALNATYGCPKDVKTDELGQKYCRLA